MRTKKAITYFIVFVLLGFGIVMSVGCYSGVSRHVFTKFSKGDKTSSKSKDLRPFITGFAKESDTTDVHLQTGKTPGEYVMMAEVALDRGEPEKAIEICQKALKLNPKYAEAYYTIGTANKMKGYYDIALKNFEECLKLDSKIYLAHAHIGSIYYTKGDFKKALEEYNKALAEIKHFPTLYNHRGLTYLMMGDYKKALKDFNAAIEEDKEDPAGYDNKAFTYIFLEKYEKAEKNIKKALKIDDEFASAYETRGILELCYGKPQRAILDFEKALRWEKNRPLSYYYIALAQKYMGKDYEEAIKKAIQIDKDGEGLTVLKRLSKYFGKSKAGKDAKEIVKICQELSFQKESPP